MKRVREFACARVLSKLTRHFQRAQRRAGLAHGRREAAHARRRNSCAAASSTAPAPAATPAPFAQVAKIRLGEHSVAVYVRQEGRVAQERSPASAGCTKRMASHFVSQRTGQAALHAPHGLRAHALQWRQQAHDGRGVLGGEGQPRQGRKPRREALLGRQQRRGVRRRTVHGCPRRNAGKPRHARGLDSEVRCRLETAKRAGCHSTASDAKMRHAHSRGQKKKKNLFEEKSTAIAVYRTLQLFIAPS